MFMYNYVLSASLKHDSLPVVAQKTVPTKRASLDGVTRYARALSRAYPEQRDLISDIAKAAKFASNRTTTKRLFDQLVDLERYLISTRY